MARLAELVLSGGAVLMHVLACADEPGVLGDAAVDTADTAAVDTPVADGLDTAAGDTASDTHSGDTAKPARPHFTVGTYPRVDGSTSTEPLARLIAAELFGVGYLWLPGYGTERELELVPVAASPDEEPLVDAILQLVAHNKTQKAFENLVDGVKDLILVANPASSEIRARADRVGVALVERPIALDALVILVNAQNPITGLSHEALRAIYQGTITDWGEVGGPAGQPIEPYVRPASSGSQQLFDAIVMGGQPAQAWPEDREIAGMGFLVDKIATQPNAIGYSVYYFVTFQYPSSGYRILAIDGLAPTRASIAARTYPFVAPVLMDTRADLLSGSPADLLRRWLVGPEGQAAVGRSGYVPHPDLPVLLPPLGCAPAFATDDGFGPRLPSEIDLSCCSAELCANLGLACDFESCRCVRIPCDNPGSACPPELAPAIAARMMCHAPILDFGATVGSGPAFCHVAAGDNGLCADGTQSVPPDGPELPVLCSAGCDLFGADCPSGSVCSSLGWFPGCRPGPGRPAGADCDDARPCGDGLVCAAEIPGGTATCARPSCGFVVGAARCGDDEVCEPLYPLVGHGRCRRTCDAFAVPPSSGCGAGEYCQTRRDDCGGVRGLCRPRGPSLGQLGAPCGWGCDAGLVCSYGTCTAACRVDVSAGPGSCGEGLRCFPEPSTGVRLSALGACRAPCVVGAGDCPAGTWCGPVEMDVARGVWIGFCR